MLQNVVLSSAHHWRQWCNVPWQWQNGCRWVSSSIVPMSWERVVIIFAPFYLCLLLELGNADVWRFISEVFSHVATYLCFLVTFKCNFFQWKRLIFLKLKSLLQAKIGLGITFLRKGDKWIKPWKKLHRVFFLTVSGVQCWRNADVISRQQLSK